MHQVGQVLAEHIHDHVGAGVLRRSASHAAGAQEAPPSWHVRFSKLALELIAATTTAGPPSCSPPHPKSAPLILGELTAAF